MNEQTRLQQLIDLVTELCKRVDAIEQRGGSGGKRTVWELTQIIEAKQKVCDQLKAKHSFDAAMGTEWQDQEAKKKYFEIKKQIRELNEQLASI